MVVTITSSHTVIPSEATPTCCLWLSGSDQINDWTHVPTIYVYRRPHPHPHQCPLDTLKNSLAKILVPFYPVAGRLRWIHRGRLELDCNSMGVTLLQAQSSKSIHDYHDFSPKHSIQELVPKPDYTKPIHHIPLLLLQLTTFSCGSLCIGVAFSHAVADGVAAAHFINSWAKLSRGYALEQHDMPFLDRTVLKRPQPLTPPRFEHPEFEPLPFLLGASDATAEREKEINVELLKLTGEQVEKIKQKANEGNISGSRAYTKFEAISAHIWRCACKARNNDERQPTAIGIIADIRNRLQPPLPRNYFGNATLRTRARALSGDIVRNTVKYGAEKIRDSIQVLSDEYLRSELDLIEREENVESLRIRFQREGSLEATFVGNPNLSIISWTSMAVNEADFGWGKTVYSGPAGSSSADDVMQKLLSYAVEKVCEDWTGVENVGKEKRREGDEKGEVQFQNFIELVRFGSPFNNSYDLPFFSYGGLI